MVSALDTICLRSSDPFYIVTYYKIGSLLLGHIVSKETYLSYMHMETNLVSISLPQRVSDGVVYPSLALELTDPGVDEGEARLPSQEDVQHLEIVPGHFT